MVFNQCMTSFIENLATILGDKDDRTQFEALLAATHGADISATDVEMFTEGRCGNFSSWDEFALSLPEQMDDGGTIDDLKRHYLRVGDDFYAWDF